MAGFETFCPPILLRRRCSHTFIFSVLFTTLMISVFQSYGILVIHPIFTIVKNNNDNKDSIFSMEFPWDLQKQSDNALFQTRRSKAHFCQENWCHQTTRNSRGKLITRPSLCRSIGQRILEDELGYEPIDAKNESQSWDLIFGGYLYCGDPFFNDITMQTGLNLILQNYGWKNLKPNQVWFPCMGCRESYCSKVELCQYMKSINPGSCFSLPEDGEKWLQSFNESQIFVIKGTGTKTHVHAGKSIFYVRSLQEAADFLSTVNSTLNQDLDYIAQRFAHPLLGTGDFKRKAELQIYLTITSTSPIRLYMYDEIVCILAASEYTNSLSATHDKCMLDAHMKAKCGQKITVKRRITYQEYAGAIGLDDSDRNEIINTASTLLRNLFNASQHAYNSHPINKGIRMSGASCFSYMRADFGILEDKSPFLFEINELPDKTGVGYNRSDASFRIREDSLRDLFRMVGLHLPPIRWDQRADFEAKHKGRWMRLL
jgi:Tubulin-tyrosine ligase family